MENNYKTLITTTEINERIDSLADEITNCYNNEDLVLICILKGAVYFAIDLSKKIKNDNLVLDFMRVSSYGSETESSGKINLKLDVSTVLEGKNVLIVEDIVDTGYTLAYLKDYLKLKNPKSIKVCVLLDKEERRKVDVDVDYVGFKIPNKFIFGYGLDMDEKYRNLPYIVYKD